MEGIPVIPYGTTLVVEFITGADKELTNPKTIEIESLNEKIVVDRFNDIILLDNKEINTIARYELYWNTKKIRMHAELTTANFQYKLSQAGEALKIQKKDITGETLQQISRLTGGKTQMDMMRESLGFSENFDETQFGERETERLNKVAEQIYMFGAKRHLTAVVGAQFEATDFTQSQIAKMKPETA